MSEAGPLFKRENVQPQHQKCKYPSWYWLKVLVPQLTKLITNFGINRIWEMVSFELSLKKWGKMSFVCHECVEQRKNNLKTQNFSLSYAHNRWKTSLFLYRAQNLPFLLFNLQTWCYGHCWFQQFAGHVSYELCNRPCSPQCLCSSVVEHQNTQSKGMRFDSSEGLRLRIFSHTRDRQKHLSLDFSMHVSSFLSPSPWCFTSSPEEMAAPR